ncbi:glutamine--fructose-6-phosphate transaminase (isomerizing) [Nitrososphaera viennensis]|uniref:Glutamine--fructose-6-phosphate aminotransferase [isomerizing] n=2 Tax=Nitrososphaera viennensis TaxID=1034015 RepID=A0A060HNX3_9ARCH|nr:glutamine--fructose-6-phosphate transaminase (isomerizing) [Nitrososphaera viennensis]AIC15266.1 Glucosamine-fructose-6-phosphate aminotransferase [Nitrososphaera viennensis EN76]UVS70177.1 glutamine--fructose-6-phosphate transaminase (isomerizing) [Nitrososphaera viennensis]
MCSILGYRGSKDAASLLVNGLKLMEYRGYDSVGIATLHDDKIDIAKGVGRVVEVSKNLSMESMQGTIGVGHTRWATHGGVTDSNAHPHTSCDGKVAVVHNGIIENYKELKDELIAAGHVFKSQTDSEVIAHLFEGAKGDARQAMLSVCSRLRGSYAFVAVFKDGTIAGARWEEPLIVGIADSEYFLSSDVLGFIKFTDKAVFLENGDIVIIDGSKDLQLYDVEGKPVSRAVSPIAWELGAADKGIYAHHTLKEINEQGKTITGALAANHQKLGEFAGIISGAKHVYLTGSGTSSHAAMVGKQLFSKYAKIKSDVIISSEFQYALDMIDSGSVLIAISQSGESADVLQSVKNARQRGAKILSIVNVSTSSLARASDLFLDIGCGPEIGVAATKSFTAQLAVLYSIAGQLSSSENKEIFQGCDIAPAIDKALALYPAVARVAEVLSTVNDIYLLGRFLHYPIALEGALKLKELVYVHAEGIAAGELKHGPLALMDKGTLVILINPTDNTFMDTLSNAHEMKARGATIVGVSDQNNELYDYWIQLPKVQDVFYPLVEAIPLQILAYCMAVGKKVDPDYPRNLAKSVTVK